MLIARELVRGVNSTLRNGIKCKHSCKILEYSGMYVANRPQKAKKSEKWDYHGFSYELSNLEHKCKVYEEYLIYDTMGMIGSVGGTLGVFIGFSMTGLISTAIDYFRKCC